MVQAWLFNPANAAASPVSLTVDGLNNGGNQIHGVAPGTADTDAVNVSQLKGAQAGLQEAINRVGVETQRVGAHAAAMAALNQSNTIHWNQHNHGWYW